MLCLALDYPVLLTGQAPSQTNQGPSHATQLPLAPESPPQGAVSVTQGTANSGGNSVLSTTSSVNVGPPYNGRAPNGTLVPGVLSLTLAEALHRALRFNLGALAEDASVKEAEGEKINARSALLPSVNAAISEEFERLNLKTMGVESPMFPTAVKFNYFDARAVMLNQVIVDFVQIDNLRSASQQSVATNKAARDARDLITLAVGGAYLQLIATKARISSAQAQVDTARAISDQATDRLQAGLAPRIDATRSRVQLQTEEQRLRALQADLETRKLRLARIIGLPLGQKYDLADDYIYSPLETMTEDEALQRAMTQRLDLQAASAQVKAAQDALKAAQAERIPSLSVTADFGAAGRTPSHQSTGVYNVYGTLTIPIFEGGRIRGEIEQAAAVVDQRKATLENLRGQVDQDVRQAFIDLNEAADQVKVARSNVDLAHDTLTPVFYQTLMGYDATSAGLAVSPRGLGSIAASVLVGMLVAKTDPRFFISGGFAILTFSTMWLSFMTLDISPTTLFWPIALGGLGITMVFIPLSNIALGTVKQNEVGNASGIFNFLRNVGGSVGISASNTIAQRHLQTHRNENVHWFSGANWAAQRALHQLMLRMQMHAGPRRSLLRSFSLINKGLNNQAQLWAYVDDFRYIALVCAICLPAAFLLKRVSKSGAAG